MDYKITLAICGLAVSLLAGCVTTESGDKNVFADTKGGVGLAIIRTEQADTLDSSVKTAKSGDYIGRQTAKVAQAYHISAPISSKTFPVIGYGFEADKDTLFFPLLTKRYGEIYCEMQGADKSKIYGGNARLCLRDKDGDKLYDRLWTMDETMAYPGAASGYVHEFYQDFEAPVKLIKADPKQIPEQKLAVRYNYYSGVFGNSFTLTNIAIYEDPKGHEKTQDARDPLGPDRVSLKNLVFPKTYSVGGYEIEVLGVNDKELSYKILSVPAKGDLVFIGRERKPVVVYY